MPKKTKLPTVAEFLAKKAYHGPKPEPLWIRIEREMKERAERKERPYNEVVAEWLKYYKDLKEYQRDEKKRKYNRLSREVGPPWFSEYSTFQRNVLTQIPSNIHADLIENLPTRTKKSLSDLGITLNFPKKMLLDAMRESEEDAGVFLWKLYTAYYKTPPSEIRSEYDKNAMLMMSGLVFVDLDDCIGSLNKLTECKKKPKVEELTKPKKKSQPTDPYLQHMEIGKLYSNYRSEEEIAKPEEPPPLNYTLRIRSETSLENLRQNHGFLAKRKERNAKEKLAVRKVKYKFWEAPSTLRNTDPQQVAYINKCKMLTKKAVRRFPTPFENLQFQIGTVAYTGGRPIYLLNNVAYLPTGYCPINGGTLQINGEMITNILGYWKYPDTTPEKCENDCDCMTKWEDKAINYLKKTTCRCRHRYDFYNTGEVKEKYLYPATRHREMMWDLAKVYQFDSKEEFIKKTVEEALGSKENSTAPTPPVLKVSELEDKELVSVCSITYLPNSLNPVNIPSGMINIIKIFLADLAHSPLILPHLPQANLLNTLNEWARRRVKGKLTPAQDKLLNLKSHRRWLDLKHINFKAKAFRIPFEPDELQNLSWYHRGLIQKLFEQMLGDFVTRNRENQLEQARLWWGTMFNDKYPSKAFIDTFFTYMPSRTKDVFLVRPYSTDMVSKYGGKTCPLALGIGASK